MSGIGVHGLVSVIVPAYNRAQFITRALDSILSQTYRPIELVVVDDGSTDQTSEIVREWINRNQAANFICQLLIQNNRGAAAARNTGLKASSGEYIQYLDTDDFMHPQKVEIHVGLLEANRSAVYAWSPHTHFNEITPDANFMRVYDATVEIQAATFARPVSILSTTFGLYSGMYRRRLHILAGPLNEDLKLWEDIEFTARITALQPCTVYADIELIALGTTASNRTEYKYSEPNGVRECLRALGKTEQILDAVKEPKGVHSRRILATFYHRVLLDAVSHDLDFESRAALAGMRRNRGGFYYLVRTVAFEFLWRFGLGQLAVNFSRHYSKKRISL